MALHGSDSSKFALGGILVAAALAFGILFGQVQAGPHALDTPPQLLSETGLYADPGSLTVDPRNLSFSPQYPLWTDGAAKSRWIRLPPGKTIDGSDPDAWTFPIGTRFWKQFSFGGQPVETRYMELQANGHWLYAAYQWTPDGRDAVLVGERGRHNAFPLGNGLFHDIPSTSDCKVCHQGGPAEVLGFSTLQLSPAVDHAALHAATSASGIKLDYLISHGLITGYEGWPSQAPVIAATSEAERLALGYLHGNCGQCHNSRSALANLGMHLRQELLKPPGDVLATLAGQPVKKSAPGQSADAVDRIDPGHPERSALLQRLSSRYPALQMPPLGTVMVDDEAVAVFRKWIAELNADEGQ
ncbi:MAG: hypothetical protein ACTHLT_13225 [Devosia sp.]